MFERIDYRVLRIDGEYAYLQKLEDENAEETVTVFPALFFYPKAGGRRLKH